jgi:DNA-directed RNA polymerase specialized sigma24 family protein
MRTQDAMSYEEIAGALNLSVANAKVKVHRARLKLAASLPETILP